MNDKNLYLTAEEAARQLRVSVATLYAYVSRKRVRSETIDGSRKRRYWKADIDRLSGKLTDTDLLAPQTPLATHSKITLITEGGLYFRGHDAIAMSERSTIESVAALLWQIDESALFSVPPPAAPDTWLHFQTNLEGMTTRECAFALLPMLERTNPRSYDLSPQGFARTGADALRWYAALVGKVNKPTAQPLHQFLAKALKAPAGFGEIIRRLLVLSADHEFDAITYAVRAVANVGVTPYQAITTGLIASQGQRIFAERFGAVSRLLQEILSSNDGSIPIVQRLRNGESLPGFNISVDRPDPRTTAIMGALRERLHGDRIFQRLITAEATARDASRKSMEFIVPAVFIGNRLGMHGEELGISSVGRVVGWIAHAMEQFHENELIRTHSTYVGPLPKQESPNMKP
ncbi:MAG TPA: citrate synthase [Usitatibacteraceae bacterium]